MTDLAAEIHRHMPALRDACATAGVGEPVLVSVVGSHAYGTAHERSDLDLRGVAIAPTERTWSLSSPPAETLDLDEPDVTVHELAKFCRLAAGANPTVLEVLFADVHVATDDGRLLRERRDAFLSRRASRTYGNYALGQLRRAEVGSGGSRGAGHLRREKFLLHTVRLIDTGLHLVRTGELRVRAADPEALWEIARAGDLGRVAEHVRRQAARMGEALRDSPLPEHPDGAAIDALIVELRRRRL